MDDTFYSYIISFITNHTVDNAFNYNISIGKIKLLDKIRGLSLGIVL